MKLSTLAEIRAAAPALVQEINAVTESRSVKPSDYRGGVAYFDADLVLFAADLRANESKLSRSGSIRRITRVSQRANVEFR